MSITIDKISSSITVSDVSQISVTATGFASASVSANGSVSLGVGATGFATSEMNAFGNVTLGSGFIGFASASISANGGVTTEVNISGFASSTIDANGEITFTSPPSNPVIDNENVETTLTTFTIPYTADAGTTQEYRLNDGDIVETSDNPIEGSDKQPGDYVYEMRSVDGELFSFWVEQEIVLPELEEDESTTEEFSATV